MGGTVVGATLTGRVMLHFERYKWSAVARPRPQHGSDGGARVFPTTFSLAGVEVVLAISGIGMGTIFPISTTAVQNAVQPHQMGTTTGVLNFFRSLGGALLVAAFGAIFFALLSTDVSHVSIEQAVEDGANAGIDFTQVFRGVFGAAALALFFSFLAIAAMEERPLRRHQGASPAPSVE